MFKCLIVKTEIGTKPIAGSFSFCFVKMELGLKTAKGLSRKDFEVEEAGTRRLGRSILSWKTDQGLVRSRNEDSLYAEGPENRLASHGQLCLVADGMGGHPAGDVASALAREGVSETYYGTRLDEDEDPVPLLRVAFREANRRILDEGRQHSERFGLGTTCTALLFRRDRFWLAHVGDSRAYLLRAGELRQLSRDHTLSERWIAEGKMSREELEKGRRPAGLVDYLGKNDQPRADFSRQPREMREGDRFLLCSDGLSNMLPVAELKALLRAGDTEAAAAALVAAANEHGGRDNISVIVADPLGGGGAS